MGKMKRDFLLLEAQILCFLFSPYLPFSSFTRSKAIIAISTDSKILNIDLRTKGGKMKKLFSLTTIIITLLRFTSLVPIFGFEEKMFEKSDFRERRDKLCSLIEDGVAIISNTVPYAGRIRVNPDFFYLTGVDVPEAKLILIPSKLAEKTPSPQAWKSTLYLPPHDPRRGVWDDPQLFPGEEAQRETGIENTASLEVFYAHVANLGNITETVYLPFQSNLDSPLELPPDLQFVEKVRKILPQVRIKNLTPILDELRWKKSKKEIEIMREGCKITVEAFKEAARLTKPGHYEYEIEAAVNYIFRKNGAQGAAFTIIGSGPNSCILHHMKNDRLMEKGDLLVIDIGVWYKSYSTDLTRTIPVSGSFTAEQRKIYEIVLRAQKKAISIVKPGVTLAEIHKVSMDVIDEAGYGKYFIHGVGHSLNGGSLYKPGSLGLVFSGMYGKYKMDRYFAADNPLLPGSVFTVEPGIYIPEKNLGIRIEDDILVSEDGYEILTDEAPKEIDEIERLMREKPKYFMSSHK